MFCQVFTNMSKMIKDKKTFIGISIMTIVLESNVQIFEENSFETSAFADDSKEGRLLQSNSNTIF